MTLFRTLALLAMAAGMGQAATRYIAQSAGTFSGGTSCNGKTAITVSTFNSTTLSAGDTTYLCGTITASAGASNFVQVAQSGSSGNPISILFDTGAILTATYWSGAAVSIGGNACSAGDCAGLGIAFKGAAASSAIHHKVTN